MDEIEYPKVKLPTPPKKLYGSKSKTAKLLLGKANNGLNASYPESSSGRASERVPALDVVKARELPIDIDKLLSPEEIEPLTKEYLDVVLKRSNVSDKVKNRVMEYVNNTLTTIDPVVGEHFRNTCIDMLDVLGGSRTNISFINYMQACLFVTYRLSGDSKQKAYAKVFPERVMRLQEAGKSMEYLHSYAELYSKNKAVVEVHARAILPTHIMYHDLYHRAMKVTAEIMMDENVSPKVRVDAANNILTHTKQPEVKTSNVNIRVDNDNIIDQLTSVMNEFATKQKHLIENTDYSVIDIADQSIVKDEDEEDIQYMQNDFGERIELKQQTSKEAV